MINQLEWTWHYTPVANGTYRITNRWSTYGLDDYQSESYDGATLDQWPYGGGVNQQWVLTALGNGSYRITNVYNGRDLDDNGWGTSNGTTIDTWTYGGGANQQWYLMPVDNGYYTISPAWVPSSCIDVPYASKNYPAFMQLYSVDMPDAWPNGGWGQQWALGAP